MSGAMVFYPRTICEPPEMPEGVRSTVGLDAIVASARRRVECGDRRPVLFSGSPGVGKSTAAAALAASLGRPLLVFEVAVAGLRLGQRDGLRELPLIPITPEHGKDDPGAPPAPVILIRQAERLPGGLIGGMMAALVHIATERNPRALEHYFGVRARAEDVLFIFTTRGIVSPALHAVLCVRELYGYCRSDQLAIARQMFEASGRRLSPQLIERIVHRHVGRPGMLELQTLIQNTCALSDDELASRELADAGEWRGPAFEHMARPRVGEAVAMAWTPDGGVNLVVEAWLGGPDDPDLTLFGNVGEAMRSSARIALRAVNSMLDRSRALGAGLSRPVLLNMPGSWAQEKDGQSAGLAIALALYGLATGQAPRSGLAVTGEITARGSVLPVMGAMTKLIAAEREGAELVILPAQNRGVLQSASSALRASLDVVFIESFEEAIQLAYHSSGSLGTVASATGAEPTTERGEEQPPSRSERHGQANAH